MDKPRVLAAISQEQLRLKGRIARYEAGIKKMKEMRVPYTAQPRHLKDLEQMETALQLLKDEYESRFSGQGGESASTLVEAAPLPAEAYDWYKYTGKPISFITPRGQVLLAKGEMFGVRPSTNGKHIRLILPSSVNSVYTIDLDVAKRLAQYSMPVSKKEALTASNHPGRQLPSAYPDRGHQFDQVALLQKLGLSQAEFVFLCGMIRNQILKRPDQWPFQPKE